MSFSLVKTAAKNVDIWLDDLQFYVPFSIMSYQDDERLIAKGCVQWNPVYS